MIADYLKLIEQHPDNSILTFQDVSWQAYEELVSAVGKAPSLRINYDRGKMQITTIPARHEYYACVLNRLVERLRYKLRTKIIFFGAATLKRNPRGVEPDACYYVQSAKTIGNKINLDLRVDPPPDVVLEVDIHDKLFFRSHLYEGLRVPELWRYNEKKLTMFHLLKGCYEEATASTAFPLLTSRVLTRFLAQGQTDGQHETLLAFEEWLHAQKK